MAFPKAGNQALFITFKPLTNYIVDDQGVYAIRLRVDSPVLSGFASSMKSPEAQPIAQHGELAKACWELDIQANQRFGQAQLVFHGELLRYADQESYDRGDEPERTAIELPLGSLKVTPVATAVETRFDRIFTWVDHFFGALGAPITFFLALVGVYTNRTKIRVFWKWVSARFAFGLRWIRKRFARENASGAIDPNSDSV
jgi:hypothetical protein